MFLLSLFPPAKAGTIYKCSPLPRATTETFTKHSGLRDWQLSISKDQIIRSLYMFLLLKLCWPVSTWPPLEVPRGFDELIEAPTSSGRLRQTSLHRQASFRLHSCFIDVHCKYPNVIVLIYFTSFCYGSLLAHFSNLRSFFSNNKSGHTSNLLAYFRSWTLVFGAVHSVSYMDGCATPLLNSLTRKDSAFKKDESYMSHQIQIVHHKKTKR